MNSVAGNGFWKVLFGGRMSICLFNGFSAGMPLFFLYQLIPAWLRSEGVDLKTIGLFALVGIPYTWKFLWSPLMDRYTLPFLGRRRGWMLLMQIAVLICMALMGIFKPQHDLVSIAVLAVVLSFFSASQDIVLDAYRRELLPDNELGLGNSMYVNGYRAAVFIPGGLGLILADRMAWNMVMVIISLFMLIGIAKTLMIDEVHVENSQGPRSLGDAIVKPFKEFFGRDGGVSYGLKILSFLFFYKLGDNMATALLTPFYLDLGFSMSIIGSLVKIISFWSMLVGSLIGGAAIYKIGINRSLWVFGFLQMFSIVGFAILSQVGSNEFVLALVICFEYLGVGLGTAALVSFMSKSTNKSFTATQFALFSSLIALPRAIANSITGFLIEGISSVDGIYYKIFGVWSGMGYTKFFVFCVLCAVPGMILLRWVAPWNGSIESSRQFAK